MYVQLCASSQRVRCGADRSGAIMYWDAQMVGATVVKGGVPVIQLTFMCQHVHCVKNKDGKIVEGSEVLNCAVHPDWMVWLYAHAHVIIAASIRPPCTPSSTIGCCSVTWSHRTLTGRSWNGPLSECMRCNDDAGDVRYHLQLQHGAAFWHGYAAASIPDCAPHCIPSFVVIADKTI